MPKPIIDYKKCTVCKTCVEVCPMEVFVFDEENNKVDVKKPDECIACRACEVQCSEEAIKIED